MIHLGVNIDHVATLRQARRTTEPDPVHAAALAELGGADGITVHLREDRRHIQDRDVRLLRETVLTRLNLEMGMAEEIVRIALELRPDQVTLVPEKRAEVTTEGGLDVAGAPGRTAGVVRRFREAGIRVSLFIDPEEAQIAAAAETGAPCIEIHTGAYANAWPDREREASELAGIIRAVEQARAAGLDVNAGHGLTYRNIGPAAAVRGIEEYNIGHSIISRAVLTGLREAVTEMKRLMIEARRAPDD
jgi:pyridoxine 5-phosphate synthase